MNYEQAHVLSVVDHRFSYLFEEDVYISEKGE